jgi:hypothetical protein
VDPAIVCAGQNDSSLRHNAVRDRLDWRRQPKMDNLQLLSKRRMFSLMALNPNQRMFIYHSGGMGERLLLIFVASPEDLYERGTIIKCVNRKNSKFLVRCNEIGVFCFWLLREFDEDAVAIMNEVSLVIVFYC